jgi:hypothetical protein
MPANEGKRFEPVAKLIAGIAMFVIPIAAALLSARRRDHVEFPAATQSDEHSPALNSHNSVGSERQPSPPQRERRLDRRRFWVEVGALVAAVAAAGFSGWQLRLTRALFVADQRPWVLISGVTASPFESPRAHGEIIIFNSGKTPAMKLEISATFSLAKVNGPIPPPPPVGGRAIVLGRPDPGPSGTNVLGPSLHRTISREVAITEEQAVAIQRGDLRVYFVGFIRYGDASENDYTTHFCYMSTPPASLSDERSVIECAYGNTAR